MSLEYCETVESCNVQIDPQKVKIPQLLELALEDDGMVHLGSFPCDIGEAKFEDVKKAFQKGQYKLTILPSAEIKIEIN